MKSKWNEWHHGYLGLLLLLINSLFKDRKVRIWIYIIAGIIIGDEAYQWIVDDQSAGILHWIYVNTLYQIPFVEEFNIWLDGVFGK